MVFPDFLEAYGQRHFKITVTAFEEVTQFISCEFAVRPFLLMNLDTMMTQMLSLATHAHPMVRRLATEGCRPRLPWAMAIPALKKDPGPIFPILDRLKNDPSESVRRSVANNLNDISKDHPQVLIRLLRQWRPRSKATDQLLKHGSRTLLKQGNLEVMQLFGFEGVTDLKISQFKIRTPELSVGGILEFSFDLINEGKTDLLVRLEYGVYYQKANGSLSRKVFKISERVFPENSTTPLLRRQSFKQITTRRFHPGLHQLSLIVNGQEMEKREFHLVLGQ
jgi:3-methyladenine DNA glycosylase AlkC